MNNPYKAPESHVADLTLTARPAPLKAVIRLLWLAIGLSLLQLVLLFVLDPEALILEGEFSIILLFSMLAFMLLYYFLIYYLCLFRPVHKRKMYAARWWFLTALILSLMSLSVLLFLDDSDTSLAENILNASELAVLFYGAYRLSQPECKQHLTN